MIMASLISLKFPDFAKSAFVCDDQDMAYSEIRCILPGVWK